EFGDSCWNSYSARAWADAIGDCQSIPVADDIIYIATRGVVGNVTAVRTSEGLVVFDSGGARAARRIYDTLRAWDPAPIHTVILTHGHGDHVNGLLLFDQEARARNHPPIRVIAQRNMPARFARYIATAGFNADINARQFGSVGMTWPTEYRTPDLT